MRIMIIGGGSLGLLFAGKLAQSGHDLTVVTRTKEQALELQARGITVVEPDREELVLTRDNKFKFITIDDLNAHSNQSSPIDYICLMVKQAAINNELIDQIQRQMSPNTYVIGFQNGIGHERRLSELIGQERVLLSVTTEGAKRLTASSVAHTGRGITYLGSMDPSSQIDANPHHLLFAQALEREGIHTILSKNMEVRVWSKLVINAVINPLTAILRVNNGGLLSSSWALSLMKDLYEEARSVAEALQIDLPGDLWTSILDVCEKTSWNHSSMLQDIEASRQTEIDYMNGSLVQFAKEQGLKLPMNDFVYRMIKAIEY
ncbi:ketopantoate reductase family protein [Paenibacillus roseipurpureus]|uniref:2-dehydropantoate 2-reductase n=1 Tax=Paenibacillus roseopurpureus TaxID=2918901 RepID=A0AA96LUS7_9BACL|nr:2-dehydropantoate 2-reductase [Paenibacillus sp. MBLB1832]WNR46423.1 2-dehydropantoate 2-reductase [Paenibacillus sp. MBLB1832]